MTEELKVSNYAKFKRYLENLIGTETTEKVITALGGEEKVINASFGMSVETGTAFDGALVQCALDIAQFAVKINEVLPEEKRVDKTSIYKVALLQHISKVLMYEKNTNDWEIKNRGILYKFVSNDVALKGGERSALISLNCGVTLTDQEFEAVRIIDKMKEGDDAARWYGCTLSTIIRQANELVTLVNKQH